MDGLGNVKTIVELNYKYNKNFKLVFNNQSIVKLKIKKFD